MICPHCGEPVAPVIVDEEFRTVIHQGRMALLSPREWRLFELLYGALRPRYSDWLAEQFEGGRRHTLRQVKALLRAKLRPIGIDIATVRTPAHEGATALALKFPPPAPAARAKDRRFEARAA